MANKEKFHARYPWLRKGDRIRVTRDDYPAERFSYSPLDSRSDLNEGIFERVDDSCLYLWVDGNTKENPALENIAHIEKL